MTPARLIAAAFCLVLPLTAASAQELAPEAAEAARMHLGPLAFTPRVALRDLGLDTNIFNTPDAPARDWTLTFAPGADAWLRMGRSVISSRTTFEWSHFGQTDNQRSRNLSQEARLDVELLRFVPYAGGKYVTTRQRPNDEIDVRVQQRYTSALMGLGIKLGSRLRVDVSGRTLQFDYSQGRYGSTEYADALNRRQQELGLDVSLEATPLTTFVLRSATRSDTFSRSDLRNSRSVSVVPGVRFKPLALISGSAFAGYRRFTTDRPDVPDYSGLVASVELKYIARDMTRVITRIERDVEYSVDVDEPLFIASSIGIELTQAVGLDWDVTGRVRRGTLAYQGRPVAGAAGREQVLEVGSGVGRRVGRYMRVGFDVVYARRTSNRVGRGFEGYRYGGSVTYGY